MKYRCVSYPTFEPDHTWLRQVLLFVDEVHRIVPFGEDPEDSDELKRLMECCEGAVQTHPPDGYVEITPEQAVIFGKMLDQPRFSKPARKNGKIEMLFTAKGRTEVKEWEFLHIKKIGDRVGRELRKRDMLRKFIEDSKWPSVPRGVGSLVLSMVADKIAAANGFDAVTDQPLAFALNSMHGYTTRGSVHLEGIITSAVATVYVPKAIALLTPKEYAELRKRHQGAREEFAKLTQELKGGARLDRITDPVKMRKTIDDITEGVGTELEKYRKSKAATKFNDWVPFLMTSLLPIAATWAYGPIPGLATAGFTFTVNATAKLTKKTNQFRYPKVLQTLCSAEELAWQKQIKKLG